MYKLAWITIQVKCATTVVPLAPSAPWLQCISCFYVFCYFERVERVLHCCAIVWLCFVETLFKALLYHLEMCLNAAYAYTQMWKLL